MTHLDYPGSGKRQEEGKDLIRNQEGRVAGRKKRLETFCPHTHIKLK
jgi:hypothetical protein